MSWINKLFGSKPAPTADRQGQFVYIFLPEPVEPLERGDKYEDPLDAELRLAEIGHVSGGGTSLSDPDDDGSRHVEYCGVDVEAYDLAAARALLRTHLPELGCPVGTQLHYTEEEAPLQDEFGEDGWVLGRPRNMTHPGFGV